jgi:hypothetical protein
MPSAMQQSIEPKYKILRVAQVGERLARLFNAAGPTVELCSSHADLGA